MKRSRHLEVILKLTEVCNIACTYCYYFFSGDDRPNTRPTKLGEGTIEAVVSFLNEGYAKGCFDTVQIDLHGGEPLMIGRPRFSYLLETFASKLTMPWRLAITTNAMLLDDQWIDLLASTSIGICVSIDGPEHIHNRMRIDKRGRGTHASVLRGVKLLQRAVDLNRIEPISCLCVVQAEANGREVYNYIVRELGIRSLDFLLPDSTHDSYDLRLAPQIAKFVDQAMAAWLSDDDPAIHVRVFESVVHLLVGGESRLAGFGARAVVPTAVTIGADGSIDGDDFLKPTGVDNIATKLDVFNNSLEEALAYIEEIGIRGELNSVPDDCVNCAFSACCGGGQATHRFSKSARFNNSSIHCLAQKAMFSRAASHLISTGVDPFLIASNAAQER